MCSSWDTSPLRATPSTNRVIAPVVPLLTLWNLRCDNFLSKARRTGIQQHGCLPARPKHPRNAAAAARSNKRLRPPRKYARTTDRAERGASPCHGPDGRGAVLCECVCLEEALVGRLYEFYSFGVDASAYAMSGMILIAMVRLRGDSGHEARANDGVGGLGRADCAHGA